MPDPTPPNPPSMEEPSSKTHNDRPAGGGSRGSAGSLSGALFGWLVALGVLLFAPILVLDDLAGANRPHELHNAPWVAGITLLNLGLCLHVTRKLRSYAKDQPLGSKAGALYYALWLGLLAVAALDALVFLGAASSIPAVLGS